MQPYSPHDPNRAPTRAALPQHAPPPPPRRAARPPRRNWIWLAGGALAFGMVSVLMVLVAGVVLLYGSGDILPGVHAAGVEVGGMSQDEAAQAIAQGWAGEGIILRDDDRSWGIRPAELGLSIDADATAAAAHDWGRAELVAPWAMLGDGARIRPHLGVDLSQARQRLNEVRDVVEIEPRNAGVTFIEGQVQATDPAEGRRLDVEATLAGLRQNAAAELSDGALDLVMIPVSPTVTDAGPLVQEAQQWLGRSLTVDIYDPVDDSSQLITLSTPQWREWLVASADGQRLELHEPGLRAFWEAQSANLGPERYLDLDESLTRVNTALAQNAAEVWLRVYHTPTTYTVQGGESISSIGYTLGIPYPWIQSANPGAGALSPGQQITIPSYDDLLPLPVVRAKRIVVSISQQTMWAYENGELLWNWPVSTGIARSPTSPGIFQIRSHDVNAYASQWNLYMPHFMGVYEPGPNAGVMNGFHGFPTDARGGYLLWENSLGSPATYGCILLSLTNAEQLFTWAEEGVVVEIQP